MPPALVLAYHAVSPNWPSTLAVSPDQLREQLESVLASGHRPATFSQILRGEAPRKPVAVTFDDGCRSVLENAFPVLLELGLPGTIFVPTDHVGSPEPMSWEGIERWAHTPHEDELMCLDWDELRALNEAGWEIGSHTRSHPHLPRLDDEALADELAVSREIISDELGAPCTSLAYPYGDNNERVCAAAETAGYLGAATMRPGPPDSFRFPRVGVYPADVPWRFRTKASPTVLRVRGSRVGQLLERQGQALRGTAN
jgi:peptidoglycan/xylan/chitin deacetylase (PgdA/CDA1 family)